MCGGRSCILYIGPLTQTNNLFPNAEWECPSASINKGSYTYLGAMHALHYVLTLKTLHDLHASHKQEMNRK